MDYGSSALFRRLESRLASLAGAMAETEDIVPRPRPHRQQFGQPYDRPQGPQTLIGPTSPAFGRFAGPQPASSSTSCLVFRPIAIILFSVTVSLRRVFWEGVDGPIEIRRFGAVAAVDASHSGAVRPGSVASLEPALIWGAA